MFDIDGESGKVLWLNFYLGTADACSWVHPVILFSCMPMAAVPTSLSLREVIGRIFTGLAFCGYWEISLGVYTKILMLSWHPVNASKGSSIPFHKQGRALFILRMRKLRSREMGHWFRVRELVIDKAVRRKIIC